MRNNLEIGHLFTVSAIPNAIDVKDQDQHCLTVLASAGFKTFEALRGRYVRILHRAF